MHWGHLHAWNVASNAGLAAEGGLTGAAYIWGHITHNERMRETGVLATEAMINALGVDYAIAGATGRERPIPANYQNVFWNAGTSFPSDHAALSWAFASVIAQEYPHLTTEIAAYGTALGVSLARRRKRMPTTKLRGPTETMCLHSRTHSDSSRGWAARGR